jgi:hypothetical protein
MPEYNNPNQETYINRFKDSIIYAVIAFIISMLGTKYGLKYETNKCLQISGVIFVVTLFVDYLIYISTHSDLGDRSNN